MKQHSFFGLVLSTVLVIGSTVTIACNSMGPNTHVGMITAIDNDAKTLTIQDAETNKPITFVLSNKQLLQLEGSNHGQVIVGYAEVDGQLIASNIK